MCTCGKVERKYIFNYQVYSSCKKTKNWFNKLIKKLHLLFILRFLKTSENNKALLSWSKMRLRKILSQPAEDQNNYLLRVAKRFSSDSTWIMTDTLCFLFSRLLLFLLFAKFTLLIDNAKAHAILFWSPEEDFQNFIYLEAKAIFNHIIPRNIK